MAKLFLYNTLTRRKEEFKPLKDKVVTFYQCGPTVYWTQHIGNMRAMVLADLMVRSLEYLGHEVHFVRNYTDVGHMTSDEDEGEDKMEKTAKQEKISPDQVAEKYIEIFERDVKELNCQEPWKKPKATDYIKEMQKLVQILLNKGFAYSTDLAVYFDITKVKDYTKLSGQDLAKNISDAGKGEISDPSKKHSADFALWFFKAGAHKNALQSWSSPFQSPLVENGQGFPGWHIECSAMSKKLLGNTIDIHMGGVEHIPVHHTNEIAQSEAANGVKFVNYWLHNEHLTVDGGKMAKSAGTSYSLQEIKDKGFDPLALRFLFLQAHYRSKQNFTWKALQAAQNGLNHLRDKIVHDLNGLLEEGLNTDLDKYINSRPLLRQHLDFFSGAISDDFNIPEALAIFHSFLGADDRSCFDLEAPMDKLAFIMKTDKILGLGLDKIKVEKIPEKINNLAKNRQQARENKDWKESDDLRDEITKLGWIIEDNKKGYKLKKK